MKVKKVNIYLDKNMKEKLTSIAKKNHVSMSTVISELLKYYTAFQNIDTKAQGIYLRPSLEQAEKLDLGKTSIKPKMPNWLTDEKLGKHKNRYITNICYMFVYNQYDELIGKEIADTQKRKFYATLQKRKEEYYNYNTLLRNNVRMAKDKKFMQYMEKLNQNATKRN